MLITIDCDEVEAQLRAAIAQTERHLQRLYDQLDLMAQFRAEAEACDAHAADPPTPAEPGAPDAAEPAA